MTATILSVCATVLSVASLWYAHRATKANERLADIEQARRDEEVAAQEAQRLVSRTAVLSVTTHGADGTLTVRNHGPHRASSVVIEAVDDYWPVLDGDHEFELLAREEVRLRYVVNLGDDPYINFRIEWVDGNGEHSEVRQAKLY
jgi:hypothetical protein